MPIEPIFSEASTDFVAEYPKWLQTVKTGSGTVIQTKWLSLWHAYPGAPHRPVRFLSGIDRLGKGESADVATFTT